MEVLLAFGGLLLFVSVVLEFIFTVAVVFTFSANVVGFTLAQPFFLPCTILSMGDLKVIEANLTEICNSINL